MLLSYFSEKLHPYRQSYKLLGSKDLFKKVIYQRYDELLLEKYLDEETNFSFEYKLDIQSLDESHLDALNEFCNQYGVGGRDPSVYLNDYLKNDCKGFIAMLKGNIIGYIWWGNNKMRFDFKDPDFKFIRDEVKLADGDVYGFDFFIAPQYRCNGNAIEFATKVFSALKRLGYSRVIGYVSADNRPAKWIYSLLGFKEFRRVTVRRFLLFILLKNKKVFLDSYGHKTLVQFDKVTTS